jgi:signal peptidase I
MSDDEVVINSDNAEKKSEFRILLFEILKLAVIALVIILPIRYYIVQPFFVRGDSMEPSFKDGDYLIVDEISYRFSKPERGDVIIFKIFDSGSQFYIKRIIGLPGEKVQIEGNEIIIINDQYPDGQVLEEDYLASHQRTNGIFISSLDEDEYYVLGDNRLQSADSRRWGAIDKSDITGKAFIRAWPFNRVTKF